MAARTHLATIAGTAPGQRLEVSLVAGREGRIAVELRQQHFADGIGWFDQRSLELDPRQLRQLQALLGPDAPALTARGNEPRSILPFPGPRDSGPPRSAVGE